MTNKTGNGVNGKYMEYIDYKLKHIDKLEDLKGYEWEYKNAEFILEFGGSEYLFLKQKNGICSNGKIESLRMRAISLLNLSELKFYGLKVILNEKPKITRKEREFTERIKSEFYLVRDKSIDLYLSSGKPYPVVGYNHWRSGGINLKIDIELFPFITWEAQKAWSKTELMELEVVE